jgi:hypothetical protein
MSDASTTTEALTCEHGEPGGCGTCSSCRHHGCSGCYYGRPPYGGADRIYTLRLPADLHDALKARAKADDRRLAQTFRAALRTYLTRS